jgi:hypothetical protein
VGCFSQPTIRIYIFLLIIREMLWSSWLRRCATSREVAGSFPHNVMTLWHHDPGTGSASKRHENQEYLLESKCGRCVRLTTLPHSCTDCNEIWDPQTPGTLRACTGLYRDYFNFTFVSTYILYIQTKFLAVCIFICSLMTSPHIICEENIR